MSEPDPNPDAPPAAIGQTWLTPGVRGIGLASLLSDLGHEIPTALLPSFLVTALGAPAAALGLIEGLADALSGIAKVVGGALADDPGRRRSIAVGGYTLTAVLSALIGLSTAVWQVAIFRTAAWTARGIRGPSRNALLADAVDPAAYGRAYGFERAMDNAGAVLGPLLALGLVALIGIRQAILLSVIPGLLAAVAIVYAVRHLQRPRERHTAPLRIVVRPLLHGPLGRLLVSVSLFEAGNVAATLLILRTSELLAPSLGIDGATTVAIALYVAYNVAATLTAVPAGRVADARGARLVFAGGVACFAAAYLTFAFGSGVVILGAAFVAAGVGIGAAETAENAAIAGLASTELRGSAFGLLAGIQSAGDFIASAVVGLVWTLVSS
ncbi:MAG: MFS transporter, partial [Chloroflexota bacterium]|nr:MFS transporter [Chloroflexota bacterium]